MLSLTEKEREAMLVLFKDFAAYYNANSISNVLKISHVGAHKILKRLLHENLVKYQQIGKSIVYRLRLGGEAHSNFRRWGEEFKELFEEGRIIMLFGSTVKNYETAKDIDIMIVAD